MTQKILVEGWDDFSLEEQKAIHAWIKGLLDARLAKQKFLDIYCFRDFQSIEIPTSSLLTTTNSDFSEDSYVVVSSAFGEEENIVNIQDFVKPIISNSNIVTSECQQCLNNCRKSETPIECRMSCRENECNK